MMNNNKQTHPDDDIISIDYSSGESPTAQFVVPLKNLPE